MSVVLPNSMNYTTAPSLPDTTQLINVAAAPSNGNSFTQNNQIFLDLVQRGFLDPSSLYLSYTIAHTGATANSTYMIQNPAYQPIQRLDVQVGSTNVETIQSYNLLAGALLSNVMMSTAEKYGMQVCYVYNSDASGVVLENLDGRLFTSATETFSVAVPLVCILSNAEKLIPLNLMPAIRIALTLESIANIYGGTLPSTYTITNVQLRYKVYEFGGAVEDMVTKMNPDGKFYIKSQSFGVSSQTLPSSSSGFQELVYNSRYASIKSLYAVMGSNRANKQFESVDLTAGTGDYCFSIGGNLYPQIPLSARTNKAGILQELRSATGAIMDRNNSMSINTFEFNINDNVATVWNAPAKFFIGTSTERIDPNSSAILSGVSSQNSPITFRINLGSASTSANSTISLVVNYDALLEIDAVNRQASVKQ
jgi:hypothetical protein